MHPGQTGTGHFGQSPAVQVDHAELKFLVFLCNLLYCPGLSESCCIDQHTDIRILILQPVFHLLVYQILFHVPCKDPDIDLVAFLNLFQLLFTAPVTIAIFISGSPFSCDYFRLCTLRMDFFFCGLNEDSPLPFPVNAGFVFLCPAFEFL